MVCKVLVVDDETELLEVAEAVLRLHHNIDVVTADTAIGLAERIARERPDVVLLDLKMPEVSGDAALARLRQLGITVPIVVFTASTTSFKRDSLQNWVKKMGANDFIQKPFDIDGPNGLLTVIERNCPHEGTGTTSYSLPRGTEVPGFGGDATGADRSGEPSGQ